MKQGNDNSGRFNGWLSLFDVNEVKKMATSAGSRSMKRKWIKEGYSHLLSLYGVAVDAETGDRGYKRIEVLSNRPWTERVVLAIYEWFNYMIPGSPYTIWLYDGARDSITIVGRYE